MTRTQPLLLVFDLNGTLLCRIKRSNDKKLKQMNSTAPAHPAFTANGSQVYLRNGLVTFIESIFALKNVSVGVWTSAQRNNAYKLSETIFGNHFDKLVILNC